MLDAMGLFGRKKDNEQAANETAVEHVLSGGDIHEGSPFYEKQTPEAAAESEQLFFRAGSTVALYVLQLGVPPPATDADRLTVAAKAMFAGLAAKADFYRRCQQYDPAQVDEAFTRQCNESWTGFVDKNPLSAGFDQQALTAEARALTDQNWTHIMTLASAYAHSTVNVEGREFEFLDQVYVAPDEYDDQNS